ncbi:MAG: aspartate--tRNA(Asn) ligase [Sulfolobales archaeon]|nr:aspartate--tRNA(Asn) ligase [Sulfolobales archaeon]MCX8208231.1 aspartate--tRNA(Asn) ligase [Sulfolobales archaeon]MDW8011101.1 aspartate--tRNA(Asn) ligase [Sulfolobales archaeon]
MSKYRTHLSSELGPNLDGASVVVAGWVHAKRDLGGKKFLLLRDKDGVVQVVIGRDRKDLVEAFYTLTQESTVSVVGTVRADPRAPGGFEIVPSGIVIHSLAKTPLPLDVSGKVPADVDTRFRERVLDLRRDESRAIFKILSVALRAIREELYGMGFVEVFTPKIVAAATEGGAALFPVAYFGREAYLAQSPQLYKELLAGSLERVFEIAPAWRAEESDTPYHLSEFISVDIEMAFANYETVMNVLERVVARAVKEVREVASRELKLLNHELREIKLPVRRITYSDSVRILAESGEKVEVGEDLSTPHLRRLSELIEEDVYFIVDWPDRARPFYTMPKEDGVFSESFDFVWNYLEIASGSTRVHRKELLVKRLEERGLNPENFSFFLKWFDYGMPPHAGWGMGLARLGMMLTGARNVRELTAFPRDKRRLVP